MVSLTLQHAWQVIDWQTIQVGPYNNVEQSTKHKVIMYIKGLTLIPIDPGFFS